MDGVPEEVTETDRLPTASTKHNNADLFIWALELAGGRSDYVDIEDVYYKCFEVAPERFSWRTRPHLPDLTRGSEARRVAIKRQKGLGIVMVDALEVDVTEGKSGVSSFRWRLTSLGAEWCDRYRERLTALYGRGDIPVPSTRVESRRVRELRESSLFKQWDSGDLSEPSIVEIAGLLECSPASERKVFSLRFDQTLEDARLASDTALAEFVKWLKTAAGEPDATT